MEADNLKLTLFVHHCESQARSVDVYLKLKKNSGAGFHAGFVHVATFHSSHHQYPLLPVNIFDWSLLLYFLLGHPNPIPRAFLTRKLWSGPAT